MKLYLHRSLLIVSFFVVCIASTLANVKPQKQRILQVNLRSEVNSVSYMTIRKGLDKAISEKYDWILLNMNTYGGELVYADSIRTALLNAPMPVCVFINNNAASAGALISIACDKIFMRASATIGAATVVDQSGAAAQDKYQSYMRGIIRATAQSQGRDTLVKNGDTLIQWKRDPQIAEAMVDPDVYIPGIVDSGKIVTFTANEALANGYCDGIVENVTDLIVQNLSISNYQLDAFKLKGWDHLKGEMMSTAFKAILIMLIIGGIWFELQAPGIGFPTLVAVVSAIFYFAPLYMDGLAQNWEIVLFVLGFVLLFMEVFVIPGFGVAGVSGILAMVVGLTAALVDNATFEFKFSSLAVLSGPLMLVSFSMITAIGLSLWLTNKIGMKGSLLRRFALTMSESKAEGFVGVPAELVDLVGTVGVADTILRPAGKVRIDGKMYDAKCEYGYIDKGQSIRVLRSESGQLYVVKAEA
jgi:membrane-bound serine protease (ClpP class)